MHLNSATLVHKALEINFIISVLLIKMQQLHNFGRFFRDGKLGLIIRLLEFCQFENAISHKINENVNTLPA